MIIWINGAFGAGKTTCAYELNRRLPGSFVYDPERAGRFIRQNTPREMHKPDFQDTAQWRAFNYEMLRYISAEYKGVIITPMTLVKKQYYDEIITRLMDDGIELQHFILYASKDVLLKRIRKRLEGGKSWAASKIDICINAFDNVIPGEKIYTDNKQIDYVVEEIAKKSRLSLVPDRRNAFRKNFDRTFVTINHIRF